MRISNLIVYSRVTLAGIFAYALIVNHTQFPVFAGVVIIAIIFFGDVLDGYLARKFAEVSDEGAFLDIAGDRLVEVLMLLPFLVTQLLHPGVVIFLLMRGALIDYIRHVQSLHLQDKAPFNQLRHPISKFLIKSRLLRFTYGIAKVALTLVLFVLAQQTVLPGYGRILIDVVSLICVVISLLRTIPVLVEYARS